MILIVSENMGLTIAKYRTKISGLSRCRLMGKLDGVSCKIIPRHCLGHYVNRRVTKVIFDSFEPTFGEKSFCTTWEVKN